jgi:chromosomal replication initiation ATPase DnaA
VENLILKEMKAEIFNQYASEIAHIFDINEEDLFIKSKKRDIVDARFLLYYICHKRPMRLVNIQRYMKGRGYDIFHNNILYGIKTAKKRARRDKDYAKIIKALQNEV